MLFCLSFKKNMTSTIKILYYYLIIATFVLLNIFQRMFLFNLRADSFCCCAKLKLCMFVFFVFLCIFQMTSDCCFMPPSYYNFIHDIDNAHNPKRLAKCSMMRLRNQTFIQHRQEHSV